MSNILFCIRAFRPFTLTFIFSKNRNVGKYNVKSISVPAIIIGFQCLVKLSCVLCLQAIISIGSLPFWKIRLMRVASVHT